VSFASRLVCLLIYNKQTSLLTVNKSGIVWLTVQYDLIVSISFVYYPRDSLRQPSADVLSLKQCLIYS